MYNILVGGAAGQGIDTTVGILEKLLKKSGYNVFTSRDFMSRIRGGHNFSLIRFGTEVITSHNSELDGITYDPSDKVAAFQKAMEIDERIPIGVIYQEQKRTFHQKNIILQTGDPLLDRKTAPDTFQKLMKPFNKTKNLFFKV